MKQEKMAGPIESGRYLNSNPGKHTQHRQLGKCLAVILLLAWDGLLLYMIVECLIAPVYGAAFVAVVSVYLGNKL